MIHYIWNLSCYINKQKYVFSTFKCKYVYHLTIVTISKDGFIYMQNVACLFRG